MTRPEERLLALVQVYEAVEEALVRQCDELIKECPRGVWDMVEEFEADAAIVRRHVRSLRAYVTPVSLGLVSPKQALLAARQEMSPKALARFNRVVTETKV